MQALKFKTNINCGGCVKAVTAFLDDVDGIQKWTVDIQNPDKVLLVEGDTLDAAQVVEAVQDAGFEIVELVEN